MADLMLLINETIGPISVNDMGIYLEEGESIDILEIFTEKEILDSEDLISMYDSGHISFLLNNQIKTIVEIRAYFERLTEYQHERLDTLTHQITETSYFDTLKDANSRTYLITYYTDASKALKIREERIIRDNDGRTSQIEIKQYDSNGDIYNTEMQTLNRNIDGTVGSIGTING